MCIDIEIPLPALSVIERLEGFGYEAFAVGGCVRDSILGRKPNDWDVTTSARPDDVLKIFDAAGFKAVATGIEHGTVTVICENEPIEVTTYRLDGDYIDCRHPESVSFTSSIEDDLARRDFTVNAIAYSNRRGIVDPYGGQKDIADSIIRCVGEPERRFREDALRILRALRFSSVLGFEIAPDTAKAAVELSGLVDRVSRERVYSELSKLICGKNAARVIELYRSVIESVMPISDCCDAVKRLGDVNENRDTALMYSVLLFGHDSESILRGLKADKKTILRVKSILSENHAEDRIDAKLLCSRAGIDIAREIQLLAFAFGRIEYEGVEFINRIIENHECVSVKQLKINGGDLILTGIEPVRIGDALNSLLREVIKGNIPNERSSLIETAARKYL